MGGAASRNRKRLSVPLNAFAVAAIVAPEGPMVVEKVRQDFEELFAKLVPVVVRTYVGGTEVFISIYPLRGSHVLELCITDVLSNIWFAHVLPHQILEHSAHSQLSWRTFARGLQHGLEQRAVSLLAPVPSLTEACTVTVSLTLSAAATEAPSSTPLLLTAQRAEPSRERRCLLFIMKAFYEREMVLQHCAREQHSVIFDDSAPWPVHVTRPSNQGHALPGVPTGGDQLLSDRSFLRPISVISDQGDSNSGEQSVAKLSGSEVGKKTDFDPIPSESDILASRSMKSFRLKQLQEGSSDSAPRIRLQSTIWKRMASLRRMKPPKEEDSEKKCYWRYMGHKGNPLTKPLNIIRVLRVWQSMVTEGTELERFIGNRISPVKFLEGVAGMPPNAIFDYLRELTQLFATARDLLVLHNVLSSNLDIDAVIQTITNEVVRLLNCEHASLYMLGPEQLVRRTANGDVTVCPTGRGIVDHVIRTGFTINVRQPQVDTRFDDEVDGDWGTRSLLAVPVYDQTHKVIAVLSAANKLPNIQHTSPTMPNLPPQTPMFSARGFTVEDELVLNSIASQAGLHLHNTQLYEQVLSARNEFKVLLDIAQALGSSQSDIQRLMQDIMTAAQRLSVAGRSVVYLVDKTTDELIGKLGNYEGERRVSVAGSIPGRAVLTGRVQNVKSQSPVQSKVSERSTMVAPIKNHEGEVIAVCELTDKADGGDFNEEDEQRLAAFASIAGVSLQNALLYETSLLAERQTQVLLQTSAKLAAASLTNTLVQAIATAARELVSTHWCAFYAVDYSAQQRRAERLASIISPDAPPVAQVSLPISRTVPLGCGIIGHVALSGNIANIRHMHEDARYEPALDGRHVEAFLCIPIYSKRDAHQVAGVLVLANFNTMELPEFPSVLSLGTDTSVSVSARLLGVNSVPVLPRLRHDSSFAQDVMESRKQFHLASTSRGFVDADVRTLEAFAAQCSVALDNAETHTFVEHVLRSIPSYVLLLDADGRLVSANQPLEPILGGAIGDPTGRHFTEWLQPNVQLIGDVQQVYDAGVGSVAHNFEFVMPGKHVLASPRASTQRLSAPGQPTKTVNYRVQAIQSSDANSLRGRGVALVVIEDISPHMQQVMALSRYMSPGLVKSLLEKPEQLLGGVRLTCTVLFSDIRGFTGLSEKLEPGAVVATLNDYFGYMCECVLSRNGIIDKYVGDAIMAVFGHPSPHPDDARNACEAAVAMLDQLRNLNSQRGKKGDPPLQIGIGINTGPVVSGNIGIARRMEYTVIGHHVNLASRAEGMTKQYGVTALITQNTYSRVEKDFECRELDFVVPPGTSSAIRVYELLGPSAATLDGRFTPTSEVDTAATATWRTEYEAGLRHYQNRAFSLAIPHFEAVREVRPNDGPAGVMIDRCRELLAHPPPVDWDASWHLSKM
eukprot:TRINITY_DN2267_c0_g1_i1.p1 TRINITY_DN2267_c0_g1~~TRINITY_DN2267_c0_g1_i1.p1  ORF type:complete len:1423 (+),score=218.53 TRINITY_DN2267_c0_g1_i1:40-4269(+)